MRAGSGPVGLVLASALLMAVTMGSRSAFGLFVSPLATTTGLAVSSIALAAAAAQLAWGLAQPVWGACAERFGTMPVLALGAAGLAVSTAMLPFGTGVVGLTAVCIAMGVAGAAAGSNALLLAVVGRGTPAAWRGMATGIVGAGGSAGQLALGPLTQTTIVGAGAASAAWGLAVLALLAMPLALVVGGKRRRSPPAAIAPAADAPVAADRGFANALRSRDFWCIAGGFGVCGFHVAFLTTHMPGVIEACGLPAALPGSWLAVVGLFNILGSIGVGLVMRRWSMRGILFTLYGLRAAGVAAFLAVPASEPAMLAFGVWIGLTYMATLPPTSGLVGRLFGLERFASLFGVVMLVHQLGAFAGALAGGIAVDLTGNYRIVWLVDIGLALAAALAHLPVREHRAPSAAPGRGPAVGYTSAAVR